MNNAPLKSIKFLLLLVASLIVLNSCKKEILAPLSDNKPSKNIKFDVITYGDFLSSINTNSLGLLKPKLVNRGPANKLLSIADDNSFGMLAIYTDSVQKFTTSNGTSYVFKMALSSRRSVSFRNLTVFVNSSGKTSAFIATYTPTRKWIDATTVGKTINFDGDVSFTPIRLESANLTLALSTGHDGDTNGGKVMSAGNKTMVVSTICYSYMIFQRIDMQCSSGHHWPGDYCDYYFDPDGFPPYYDYGFVEYETCFDVDLAAESGGGGGSGPPAGGGGSNPTPPGNYNPCNSGPIMIESARNEIGLKLAVVPPSPCDGGEGGLYPLPPIPPPANTNNDLVFIQHIVTTNLKPCMKKVLDKIALLNSSIPGIIREFSGNTPGFNWNMADGILIGDRNASTNPYDKPTKSVTTIFDGARLSNSSDLFIASLIMHESVHAYLVTYFANDPINANITYKDMVTQWTSSNKATLNDVHHDEFIKSFISKIAISLKEYGDAEGYTFNSEAEKQSFYEDLAWSGLEATNAFTKQDVAIRNRITNIISTEFEGKDRSGYVTKLKGKKGGC